MKKLRGIEKFTATVCDPFARGTSRLALGNTGQYQQTWEGLFHLEMWVGVGTGNDFDPTHHHTLHFVSLRKIELNCT